MDATWSFCESPIEARVGVSRLWNHYVFRRGVGVAEMWDRFLSSRQVRLLYIAGRGFDPRAQSVLSEFVKSAAACGVPGGAGELLLIALSGYELAEDLKNETERNAKVVENLFEPLGPTSELVISASRLPEDELTTGSALHIGVETVLSKITNQTDVVLDVSSLPRIVYLGLVTAILQRLVPDKTAHTALFANGVNFQVLVAEDVELDNQIRSEDPNSELVTIPGFSSVLHAESMRDWPLVWFPILGENRVGQFERVLNAVIPDEAEICPILPHPSRDLRRGERLLIEYKTPLFDRRVTPMTNVMYVSESNPFECYRQLAQAMSRYQASLGILGGCRLAVTPLSSKLVTLGACLACFEMRPDDAAPRYGVAIPYAEPTRYVVPIAALRATRPEIASMVLTGVAYGENMRTAGGP